MAACLLAAAALSAGPLDSLRRHLLEPNGISPGDLDLYPREGPEDGFRLPWVKRLLRRPLEAHALVSEVRELRLQGPEGEGPLPPDRLWPLLDVKVAAPRPAASPALGPEEALAELERIRGLLNGFLGGLRGFPAESLLRAASEFFLMEEDDTTLGALEVERERLRLKHRETEVLRVAAGLSLGALAEASLRAHRLRRRLVAALSAQEGFAWKEWARAAGEKGPDMLRIGSRGADRHAPSGGILLDPGGDDVYEFSSSTRPGDILIVIDVSGRDQYLSADSLAVGPGHLGIFLLNDLEGDDQYSGANFAFGSALFGYSHLHDAGGHDRYHARCASLGFAFFGVGVLEDAEGHDIYRVGLLGQGASATKGLGLLLDERGNDQYLAAPTFVDDLRYNDRNLHMVQGFSTGFRPDVSGGLGVLWDRTGADLYVSDIYGQGSAYWFGIGLLLDEGGNDSYQSFQYAQGAGVHMAAGIAWDEAGDDRRSSKGVSLGCGHDLGLGLLYDGSGNDSYLATDMSLGAGSANGVGLLLDMRGDDAYLGIDAGMSLGHADMRRDRGSFGFFLDLEGRDRFAPPAADGRGWRIYDGDRSGNGLGLDR